MSHAAFGTLSTGAAEGTMLSPDVAMTAAERCEQKDLRG
jgi:hypothetical protein